MIISILIIATIIALLPFYKFKDDDKIRFGYRKGFEITFSVCGYFDPRPRIDINLFFFFIRIVIPYDNKKWSDECDPPKWGIAYHGETLWIYRGGKGNMNGGNKWWTIYAPHQLQWVRTSVLRKDGTWEHETKKNRKSFYKDEWKDILWKESYPYTYVLKSGSVQNRIATIKVEEREWRPHWTKLLPIFKRISKTIYVSFDDEVGERSGSWKGGTTGCGYEMNPGETPLECLRRMEIEIKF